MVKPWEVSKAKHIAIKFDRRAGFSFKNSILTNQARVKFVYNKETSKRKSWSFDFDATLDPQSLQFPNPRRPRGGSW